LADYPDAIDYFVDESRVFINRNSHSAIVLHGTGGNNPNQTAEQLGDFFRTTPARTSVHYGIDRMGTIAQYVLEQHGAAGNCCIEEGHDPFWDQFGGDNLNIHTLSIEHENDENNSLPLTDAQKQASFKLIAYLSQKYAIAPDHIKSHASIAPQSRSRCPGNAYPFNELLSFLGSGGDEMLPPITINQVSTYFEQQSDQIWKCKQTGFVIGHGILAFYCAFRVTAQDLGGLTHLGLPKSGEQGVPGKPGVVEQVFERGILAYDSAHIADNPPGSGSVYLAHINTPLPVPVSAPTVDVNKIKAATQEILAAIGGAS